MTAGLKCEHCGKEGLKGRQINWANKDHKYSRNLEDYQYIHQLCHRRYDIKKGFIKTRWEKHAPENSTT